MSITNDIVKAEAAMSTSGLGESLFGSAAKMFWQNGWSVFPQERYGDRKPSKIHGRTLRPYTDHDLVNRLPTESELELWRHNAAGDNVACVFGPASGNMFALDIDVTDESMSRDIARIAEENLGRTPFARYGRMPKVALFYRHDDRDVVRTRTEEIAGPDGGPSGHAVEILGRGRQMTVFGRHHKTGNHFLWGFRDGDENPMASPITLAPLVSSRQVDAFLADVAEIYPFYQRPRQAIAIANWTEADTGRIRTIEVQSSDSGTIIGDGREQHLFKLTQAMIIANLDAVRAAKDDDEASKQLAADIGAAVFSEFQRTALMDGNWAPKIITGEIKEKVGRTIRQTQEGKIFKEESPAMREAAIRAQREIGDRKRAASKRQAVRAEVDSVKAEEKAEEKDPDADDEELYPFRVLGHDRGVYYFLGRTKQVIERTASQLAQLPSLLEIAPRDFWVDSYPGSKGPDVQSAANHLIDMSVSAGIYKPDVVRGRGAWIEGGVPVLHLGDKVLTDGRSVSPRAVSGTHVYEEAASLDIAHAEPLGSDGGAALVELCSALPLRDQPGQGQLLAGWLAVAPVCGALPWRTHCYLTGERGNGKSWALDNVVIPALGGLALAAQGKTSEAGIRAALGHDARPVILDEFETQNAGDRQRVQSILDLFRAASSEGGAPIRKATKDQRERSFSTRSCLLASSINLGLNQAADESRFIVIEFQIPVHDREAGFTRLRELQAALITPDFAARLLGRSLKMIPAIRESAEILAAAIARHHGSRRQGDTVGVPLAGLWSLTHDIAITVEEADALVQGHAWVGDAARTADSDPEWRRAIDYVMQVPVRVAGGNRDIDVQVGMLLDSLSGRGESVAAQESEIRRALADVGIRVERKTVVFATGSAFLASAFERTDWGKAWASTICRAPHSEKTKPQKFSGVSSRGVGVPLEVACPQV